MNVHRICKLFKIIHFDLVKARVIFWWPQPIFSKELDEILDLSRFLPAQKDHKICIIGKNFETPECIQGE